MSSTLSPQKAPAPRPTGRPSPDLSPVEFVKAIYRFLHNKRVGLVLILAMALLTLLGVLFPQAPSAVQADPEAFSAWLEELRPRYRGWTDPLAWLGVFGIFSSWWSRATTLLLAISILACTTTGCRCCGGRRRSPGCMSVPTSSSTAGCTSRSRSRGRSTRRRSAYAAPSRTRGSG